MKTRSRVAALAILILAACSTPESRIKKNQEAFNSYPPEAQAQIKTGEVAVGFTSDMVRMAMGKPSRKYMRTTADSTQEVWAYEYSGSRSGVGLSIGAGSFGGSTAYGGGVSVGGGDVASSRDWATIVFEGGKVVAVEKLKR